MKRIRQREKEASRAECKAKVMGPTTFRGVREGQEARKEDRETKETERGSREGAA